MNLLTYILLHFTKDKSRTEPKVAWYAAWYKHNIYQNLLAYLQYYGWNLQKSDITNIQKYINEFFETIEKELE